MELGIDRSDVVNSLGFYRNARTLRKVHSVKRVTLMMAEVYNPLLQERGHEPVNEQDIRHVLNETANT